MRTLGMGLWVFFACRNIFFRWAHHCRGQRRDNFLALVVLLLLHFNAYNKYSFSFPLFFQIMYFMGFAIFVVEALLSIWVFQVGLHHRYSWKLFPPQCPVAGATLFPTKQNWTGSFKCLFVWLQRVYWFFRGKGTEAQMRPDAGSRAPPFWRSESRGGRCELVKRVWILFALVWSSGRRFTQLGVIGSSWRVTCRLFTAAPGRSAHSHV